MPTNIEIKARARQITDLHARAMQWSDSPVQVLHQEDTFFHVPQGRLKLRQLSPVYGQLIYYHRPDQSGPKRSDYILFETEHPESLKTVLTLALGVRGVVRKKRSLYQIGQTRLHLDEVEGLGHFLELEVVLGPDQGDAEGQAIARDLMIRLGVQEEDLIQGAYIDLLEQESACGPRSPLVGAEHPPTL